MKRKHHSLVTRAAGELIKFWYDNDVEVKGIDVKGIHDWLYKGNHLRKMEKWSAAADDIQDLKVSDNLTSFIVKRISDATSFQHFSYCGTMGTLRDGNATVNKYDGYCWDCDPFLQWFEEIANISWADVKYDPYCGMLPANYLAESPGAIKVTGGEDWDNQVYPSALDLADYYGDGSRVFCRGDETDNALKSISFAIHMLQDLSVPHHVLSTIELNHAGYEKRMLNLWRKFYSKRSTENKQVALQDIISVNVKTLLHRDLHANIRFSDVGKKVVAMTVKRMPEGYRIPQICKTESINMTCEAIASTISALNMFMDQ